MPKPRERQKQPRKIKENEATNYALACLTPCINIRIFDFEITMVCEMNRMMYGRCVVVAFTGLMWVHLRGKKRKSGFKSCSGLLNDLACDAKGVFEIRVQTSADLLHGSHVPDRIIVPEVQDCAIVSQLCESFTGSKFSFGKSTKRRTKKESRWCGVGLGRSKPCTLMSLSESGWRGIVRNVPRSIRHLVADPSETVVPCVTITQRIAGRILLLDRLSYRGNIGTIVRSAVQANVFEAVSHHCGKCY
jgi:hypothetical protein